ncbi:class I SAM-dependent DNA methyltransferase [Actinomadura darangshiensis]|uniref:site-specific DNA-methyltransferase (adenine-specific) n=1 Tax=Actinomadura darangshiensis TaxID=705336 RepID=A0A4R5BAH6_9ACTN|nr:class I SAM-dependent DNA methyltransferase [Actinomadura darangshiensis]TDD80734.1 class I SAM-dependent DNA methyltransferase [Actinomadura darangshiensis]
MTYDSIVNRGDYFSAHYLAEVLPKDLKKKDGLLTRWTEAEKDGQPTPRTGLRALKRSYFKDRPTFADALEIVREGRDLPKIEEWKKALHELHGDVLRALGFKAEPRVLTVERSDKQYEVAVAHAEPSDRPSVIAIECGWAPDVDAALDITEAGRLLTPVELDRPHMLRTGDKLASWLFATDEPPRYVLILAGGVIILADRMTWGEGRYLAVSLDVALGRSTAATSEIETIAALFSADALLPPEEGGAEPLAELLSGSRQHAVGVSKELREGLRDSVEIIANEVLDRMREQGVRPEEVMEPAAFAKELGRESLRYLYRILFLLYAEARPELGILPTDDEAYVRGYSMARLGDLIIRDLVSEESRRSVHLYESLDLLFRMVNEGHNQRGAGIPLGSEGEGLRFEPLKSDLFDPDRTRLIGKAAIDLDEDDPDSQPIDTRLRNEALYKVLRLLMLSKGKRRERGGFISYAQLGINQLGAVYEGLMSYTGFIAKEELYEVAKNGDPKDGSWMIPASKINDYEDAVFVRSVDENGIKTEDRVRYKPGAFVYRLAGRDRQTSASYYTPESLTQVTVQLALRERLDQDGTTTKAREILDWTICEPALGSGAFLNEAINQVAAEYLKRRQTEKNQSLEPDRYAEELQKVKAYIALHNSYGVDLNETAVELAEVSLWLNVMHRGLQAPWFGLHLRRGNSLIGAGRRLYEAHHLKKKAWLTTAPKDHPFRDGPIPDGHIHHFLLPAQGWGAVASEKEAKSLAPEDAKRLSDWRKGMLKDPSTKKKQGQKLTQVQRLQGLSCRAEYLWDLVIKRLELSEKDISRRINVWGADDLREPGEEVISREQILKDLMYPGTPFWRLKTLMDAWCALWFWPLDKASLLDGSDGTYERLKDNALDSIPPVPSAVEALDPGPTGFPESWEATSLFGEDPVQVPINQPKPRPKSPAKPARVERRQVIPLSDLDDWLDFAEALLGTTDIPEGSLGAHFADLNEIGEHEEQLPVWMGMDTEHKLSDRFPWLDAVEDIAKQRGFFHWELQFGQVFTRAGFDLQVGNPPWVRPRWEEADVLAEFDPWFKLADKATANDWVDRKLVVLESSARCKVFLNELSVHVGMEILGSVAVYPVLTGTQSDLYRPFMVRVWKNLKISGIAGLIHPKSHFDGVKEGRLRAEAYAHLRLHAHFQNRRLIFDDVDWNKQFSLQIYGSSQAIDFVHVSWLFEPQTLHDSLQHDGKGATPGLKDKKGWDLRPHAKRLISVDSSVLAEWSMLSGSDGVPIEQSRLLYPVSTDEQEAIAALSRVSLRLGNLSPRISRGYDESGAKKAGLIQWRTSMPEKWSEVIVRGPQFIVATPFAKQPPATKHTDKPVDLTRIPTDAIPSTDYCRACGEGEFRAAQDRWMIHPGTEIARASGGRIKEDNSFSIQEVSKKSGVPEFSSPIFEDEAGRPFTEFYRVFWREMIPASTERSLFPALFPPGPAHIHGVRSMALSNDRETALVAGFWAGLPVDYFLRIGGRGHLDVADARLMPAPDSQHPLADALLLRALRLNCLTSAYADLWRRLFVGDWVADVWAVCWDGVAALGTVSPHWDNDTPLRTEFARRAALVEIDALVAVMLGIKFESLLAIFRSRFPQLVDYEELMWFDRRGRKIAANFNQWGHGQNKEHYSQLMYHLESPETVTPPEGYAAPFYKADREAEYRKAHAVFSERLERAKAEGWTPDGGGPSA